MRYINAEDKDEIIFSCKCGQYSFIKIEMVEFSDNEPDFYVYFMEEPYGFWDKLKWLFKKEKIMHDVILSKSDIECLVKNLSKKLKEIGKDN